MAASVLPPDSCRISPAENRRLTGRAYLYPGEVMITTDAILITTVLGSCIAVTFHRPAPCFAAMCHAVLPSAILGWQGNSGGGRAPCTFVGDALETMLRALRPHRVAREDLAVKLFGGATFPEADLPPGTPPQVGDLNVQEAERLLRLEGLSLCARDVGGPRGRKIVFDAMTGAVRLQRLERAA
jgi:chemotaxis protein CheD